MALKSSIMQAAAGVPSSGAALGERTYEGSLRGPEGSTADMSCMYISQIERETARAAAGVYGPWPESMGARERRRGHRNRPGQGLLCAYAAPPHSRSSVAAFLVACSSAAWRSFPRMAFRPQVGHISI